MKKSAPSIVSTSACEAETGTRNEEFYARNPPQERRSSRCCDVHGEECGCAHLPAGVHGSRPGSSSPATEKVRDGLQDRAPGPSLRPRELRRALLGDRRRLLWPDVLWRPWSRRHRDSPERDGRHGRIRVHRLPSGGRGCPREARGGSGGAALLRVPFPDPPCCPSRAPGLVPRPPSCAFPPFPVPFTAQGPPSFPERPKHLRRRRNHQGGD